MTSARRPEIQGYTLTPAQHLDAEEWAAFETLPVFKAHTSSTIQFAADLLPLIEEMHSKLLERGPSRISPFFIPGLIVNLAAGHISIRFHCRGPSSAPATACATGAHAIGDAYKIIQRDDADLMFAGGTEAVITPRRIAAIPAHVTNAALRSTKKDAPG